MQRIIQFWQRLAQRERILAGVAIAFLGLNILNYGVVQPYRAITNSLEESIEQESQQIAKMIRVRDRQADVDQQTARLRQRLQQMQGRLIPGDTPALAASRLQEHLRTLASSSGLEVLTTVPLRDEAIGEFRQTTLQMTLRGEMPAIAQFVADVEYGKWLLAVSSFEVRGTYSLRRARKDTALAPLTLTLEVSGVMQGAKS